MERGDGCGVLCLSSAWRSSPEKPHPLGGGSSNGRFFQVGVGLKWLSCDVISRYSRVSRFLAGIDAVPRTCSWSLPVTWFPVALGAPLYISLVT